MAALDRSLRRRTSGRCRRAREYVRARARQGFGTEADRFGTELVTKCGEARGPSIRYAEAFEVSEYGAPLTEELSGLLFPF